MASSQSNHLHHPFLENIFSRWASYDIFLFKYHFLLHILRFLFFFPDNIMADVASKQQTTALFLSTTVTRTRRHTELTNLMENLCCAREHSIQFFVQFFFTQFNLECMGPATCMYPSARDHFNNTYKETRLTDFADLLLVNEWCNEFITHCWHLMIERVKSVLHGCLLVLSWNFDRQIWNSHFSSTPMEFK